MEQNDWKEYRVEPDKGLYEHIERRVRTRRAWRWSALTATGVVVAGAALWLLVDRAEGPQTVALNTAAIAEVQVAQPTVGEAPAAETPTLRVAETRATVTPSAPVAAEEEVIPMAPMQEQWAAPQETALLASVADEVSTRPLELDELILADDSPAATEAEPPAATAKAEPAKASSAPHYTNVFTAPNIIIPTDPEEGVRQFRLYASDSSTVDHFRMAVYNRGGRQVFTSNDINRAWDGTYNGQPVTQGTYVWMATFRDGDGVLRREKGTVTVVR